MILPEKQIKQLREALETATRPLFLFDDDPDGLCSFLLLYRFCHEGKGVMVKTTSRLTEDWVRKVDEYNPDKVFILDVPVVEQEFIDGVDVPIYWVDHHMPVERRKINYFNPRLVDLKAYIPTTRMAYEVVKRDTWIAAVGCVADWYLPDFKDKLVREYPYLMDKKVNDPETALFETTTGKLARMFSFILKGKSGDVMKCVKILTRVEDPKEILEGTSSQGKFILKRFERINEKYQDLLKQVNNVRRVGDIVLFTYHEDQWSFTSELSQEIAHRNPKNVVLVCREKGGEFKCSLRSRKKPILPALEQALVGVEGFGGGHEMACGAVIKEEDFDRFVENLKEALK